jgi:hypothetical protein
LTDENEAVVPMDDISSIFPSSLNVI